MSETKLIAVDDIAIDTTQARRGAWELDKRDQALIDSIKGIGLIYEIIVRPTNSEKYGGKTEKPYALVAGSRRFHALIEKGTYEIPCKVLDLDDVEAISLSFNENVGRKDLTQYQQMITILTWKKLLENAGMSETEAIKEIADTSFGGIIANVWNIIHAGGLPKELQILIKTPKERTEQETRILKEHNISPDFKLNFITVQPLTGIVEQLSRELSEAEQVDKVLTMIGELDLASKKAPKQYDILGSVRDGLKAGKSFDVVMKEIQEDMMSFEMVRVKSVSFKIPTDYEAWHRQACAHSKMKGAKLVRKVYFDWLKKRAKKEGWGSY